MRADDLVVGDVYAYRLRGRVVEAIFDGGNWQWWRRFVIDGASHWERSECAAIMPWAEWEAQQATAGEKARERRETEKVEALGVLGGLTGCDVGLISGTLEIGIDDDADPWHGCNHTLLDLNSDDMDAFADALKTLARCLREEARDE